MSSNDKSLARVAAILQVYDKRVQHIAPEQSSFLSEPVVTASTSSKSVTLICRLPISMDSTALHGKTSIAYPVFEKQARDRRIIAVEQGNRHIEQRRAPAFGIDESEATQP
jgi:hypothetical protein